MPTATISPRPPSQLKRLILLDGRNIQEGFSVFFKFQQSLPFEPNAGVLFPLVYDLIKLGFNVRVVVRRRVMNLRQQNQLHFIITMLEKCLVTLVPEDGTIEADDRLMAQLVVEHGAVIITNDKFRNHQRQMATDLNKYIVPFCQQRNPDHDKCDFMKRIEGVFRMKFEKSDDFFYCAKDDPDFEKVKASQDIFKLPNWNRMHLVFAEIYLRSYVGFVYDFKYQEAMNRELRDLVYGSDWCVKEYQDYYMDVSRIFLEHDDFYEKKKHYMIQTLGRDCADIISSDALKKIN